MTRALAEPAGDDWVALSFETLPVGAVHEWVRHPACGANVVFTGSVRDHSPGRDGVHALHYEAYEPWVVPRLAAAVAETRRRWPEVRRAAAIHRAGELHVGDDAVVVAACSAHRDAAFAAAAFLIDTVKRTVPLWKFERWAGGEDWSSCTHDAAMSRRP
ncbi:MAG TPA: molybdenum cofactor biosynthesis protein MoaE [Acidimicrobiales bacterium]|nr:molybdenum cofactor biosynthesis protein MoaE [Acidimicrobiales bacterium]